MIKDTRCLLPVLGLLAILPTCARAQTTTSSPVEKKMPIEIVAHRGASADAPENTLASVKLGWKQNADAVEVDVHLTKDHNIVVSHDGNTRRTAGVDKNIVDQTLQEIQSLDAGSWRGKEWIGEKIPTLADVLATIPDNKRMFVEIKCGPEIIPELQRVVTASKKKPQQIAFISFSLEVCAEVKKAMPKHQVYFLCGFSLDEKTHAWRPTTDELIAAAQKAKIDGLDIACSGPVDGEFVRKVHAAGLKAFVWTVDDPGAAKLFKTIAMDGITTNRPAFLREQLSAK